MTSTTVMTLEEVLSLFLVDVSSVFVLSFVGVSTNWTSKIPEVILTFKSFEGQMCID